MQRRHSLGHLLIRGGVAAVSDALMFTGVYPFVPHAVRAIAGRDRAMLRSALTEWACAWGASVARPAGFLPLPGATVTGPRPIVALHGYAMSRANYLVLARRLANAGLGPIVGFEYWSLGRVGSAARQLAELVADIRAQTGAAQVDIIGHSMGGVVGRYYVAFAGGDRVVKNLVTIGSPHAGSDISALGIGFSSRELAQGSALVGRLANAPPPSMTKILAIGSRADALVPAGQQPAIAGADTIIYDDLGHLAMLGSRRVAAAVIERLSKA